MKTIGIITIHKINNYGSVLQAYALQNVCEKLGYKTEIIDYNFPNSFHSKNVYALHGDKLPKEPIFIKFIYLFALKKQHNGIAKFVSKYLNLSRFTYNHPKELIANTPQYDIYITGSDQVWNPRYTQAILRFYFILFLPTKKELHMQQACQT